MTWSPDDLLTRSTFRELLELLSSREAQLHYEADVPIANVPAELLCMWFDDHYHPETAWFSQAFTDHERQVLADFNARFSLGSPRASLRIVAWPRCMPTRCGMTFAPRLPRLWQTLTDAVAESEQLRRQPQRGAR